jgi:glycine dehydrogenase subunit 2
MHINVHKTFSTPARRRRPGAGPVAVAQHLEPFLPLPVVVERGGSLRCEYERPQSVGRCAFVPRQLRHPGARAGLHPHARRPGLARVSRTAILNANYLMRRPQVHIRAAARRALHARVRALGRGLKKYGVKTLDVAKRLLDFGVHAPTVYFPLIVEEALMIEPTETETLDRLDHFAAAMEIIAREARERSQQAPRRTEHHAQQPARRGSRGTRAQAALERAGA